MYLGTLRFTGYSFNPVSNAAFGPSEARATERRRGASSEVGVRPNFPHRIQGIHPKPVDLNIFH